MHTPATVAPVIAIDGGSGTGKSAIRAAVAQRLSFNEFDSGAMYRSLALLALRIGVSYTDVHSLMDLALTLHIETKGDTIIFQGKDETALIRSEQIGTAASEIAKLQPVRHALLAYQHSLRVFPGLVADGRDMGHVYNTPHRYFVVTDIHIRAKRRQLQLRQAGSEHSYEDVLARLTERDSRDTLRAASPLVRHPQAKILYNNGNSIDPLVDEIVRDYERCTQN